MKETLEKLWYEYLADECAVIETDKERERAKKAIKLHEELNSMLTKEEIEAVEAYVNSLYEINGDFAKKSFFKGCEFAISFILEAGNFGK